MSWFVAAAYAVSLTTLAVLAARDITRNHPGVKPWIKGRWEAWKIWWME